MHLQRDVTLPMLETVRRSLRGLVQFLDQSAKRENVYTNFADEMGTAAGVANPIRHDETMKDYRLKVERFVREHADHPTIDRLKQNQPISAADLDALEAILFSVQGAGNREAYQATYGTEQPLGNLVREIIGLDVKAAREAFAEFLALGTLTADQMTFINQIIDHLVHNGMMNPQALFEPPFTDYHDQGPAGVLPQLATETVAVIRRVNQNALAT